MAVLDNSQRPNLYGRSMAKQRIPCADCTYPEPVLATSRLRVVGTGHPNQIPHAYWADCIAKRIESELSRAEGGARDR